MLDTLGIKQVIARVRRRLRVQSALETATTAVIPAAVLSMGAVFLLRTDRIDASSAAWLCAAAVAAVVAGAIAGAFRNFSTTYVATRLDRASTLHDRLATACAFEEELERGAPEDEETLELMHAAIRDAKRHLSQANVKAASPFRWPRDSYAAAAFVIVCSAIAGLAIPEESVYVPVADQKKGGGAEPDEEPPTIVFEEEDLDLQRELIKDMREVAAETGDQELKELADELDQLLDKAEAGDLSKQDLLEKLSAAEKEYMKGSEEEMKETLGELKQTGRELKKDQQTRELGKALEKGDLEKAQKEMQKLAEKLDKGEMSERERNQLSKALEQAAEKFEKRQEQKDKRAQSKIDELKKEMQRLDKQMKEAKNENERERLQRRKDKKKRELEKLERKKQERQQAAKRRKLEQLHRDMKKSAKDMKSNSQQRRRQASRKMRDMQRNTGKIDQDRRRVANKKKVASQMSDLKEAMRRAKQKRKGMRERFGRSRKKNDFRRRARGQKGNKGAWKPGQGKNGKQAGNQPGGKGQKPGGSSYGDEDGSDPMGDPTGKGGHTKDQDLQGLQGREGTSVKETILSAAEKGFSSQSYKKVYAQYRRVVEEIIRAEKVPSGYRYYVKKYFQNIKPHAM